MSVDKVVLRPPANTLDEHRFVLAVEKAWNADNYVPFARMVELVRAVAESMCRDLDGVTQAQQVTQSRQAQTGPSETDPRSSG